MKRVGTIASGMLIALSLAGCMPDRLGSETDSKASKRAQPTTTAASFVPPPAQPRNAASRITSSARAYNDGYASDIAMRSVRATECIATAIANRSGINDDPSERVRELIAWAAPQCQQELDSLVTSYDRTYGSGLGMIYLRAYLRDLPDVLAGRFRSPQRSMS